MSEFDDPETNIEYYSPMHQREDKTPTKTPTKTPMDKNIEPIFDNLITHNLCSPGFKNWVDTNLNTVINSQIVRQFFLSMFALLSQYDSCFERGTFIFQNDTNVLFNILTFDKLKITSSSYNCNDPLSAEATAPVGHPVSLDNVHSMGTKTHRQPITARINLNSQAGPCVPAVSGTLLSPQRQRKNHKFERVFDDSLNLDDVCNQCNAKLGDNHHHLRLALYYPYVLNSALNYISDIHNNNNKTPSSSKLNFLFVKFETQPVSGNIGQKIAHIGNYLTRHLGTASSGSTTPASATINEDDVNEDFVDVDDVDESDLLDTPLLHATATSSTASSSTAAATTLDTRREDDPLTRYSMPVNNGLSQKDKDIRFYTSLGLPTKTLEWYNDNVRIGQEFFVSQKLLEYLLMNYLFTNYTCPGKGGKRKTRQKRNKKTHKKTRKGHKKTHKKSNRDKRNFTRKRYN